MTTYNNTGLATGTQYFYRVRANNASGNNAYSNEANATTIVDQITSVSGPTTVNPGQNITVPVGYSAAGSRDVYAEFWSGDWSTFYVRNKVTVSAGTGTANVPLTIPSSVPVGSGYQYYCYSTVAGVPWSEGVPELAQANITVAAAGLPSPWVTSDIGSPGVAGSATHSSGTYTIRGSGADIWGTSDQFRYVRQPSSGNCSMTARVLTVQNTHAYAKSGVMIRESTAAGSKFALVNLTPGGGIEFLYRTATGGSCSFANVTGLVAPYWVRVTRTSNSFAAFYSSNGTSWTQLGTAQTISMSTAATIGMAVTSHNNPVLSTSTISNVTATP